MDLEYQLLLFRATVESMEVLSEQPIMVLVMTFVTAVKVEASSHQVVQTMLVPVAMVM